MTTPVMSLSMIGQTYTFRSKNANDTTIYEGVITGFCNSDEAQRYGNIIAYNQAVRQTDSSVPTSVSDLSVFFIFRLANSTGTQTDYVFAPEWIVDGTLTLVNQTVLVTVQVYDSNLSDHSGILTALRASGYTNSSIVSTTSSS